MDARFPSDALFSRRLWPVFILAQLGPLKQSRTIAVGCQPKLPSQPSINLLGMDWMDCMERDIAYLTYFTCIVMFY